MTDDAERTHEVCTRIERWLAQHGPPGLEALGAPATEEALSSVEAVIGMRLPADVRAWYLRHDGTRTLIDDWYLMSLRGLLRDWQRLCQFWESEVVDNSGEAIGPTRAVWWSTHSIPVLSNGCGDYQCLDLDPAPAGHVGQIVTYWRADSTRRVVAQSLVELLERFAIALESSAVVARDGELVRNVDRLAGVLNRSFPMRERRYELRLAPQAGVEWVSSLWEADRWEARFQYVLYAGPDSEEVLEIREQSVALPIVDERHAVRLLEGWATAVRWILRQGQTSALDSALPFDFSELVSLPKLADAATESDVAAAFGESLALAIKARGV